MFFFFKQKTAYEMRMSDWSSDVCSSDLVSVLQPSDTGWSQSFTTLNDQSAKVPVWWAFMHALSRGLTSASVAAIPCGTELRQLRMEIVATRIDDPVLAHAVTDFSHACYGPARAILLIYSPELAVAKMQHFPCNGISDVRRAGVAYIRTCI